MLTQAAGPGAPSAVDVRALDRLAEAGILTASVSAPGGRGSRRVYDFGDLVAARCLALAGQGRRLGAGQARELVGAVQEAASAGQLRSRVLSCDLQAGRWSAVEHARSWQLPAAVMISLEWCCDDLAAACDACGLPGRQARAA